MALVDTTWYCNFGDGATTGYFAVAKRPQNAAVVAGQLCRQFTAPSVAFERVFVCIVAGTTANVTDATWALTRGAKTTDGTATWMEVTGQPALNGDLVNTATWAQVKAATPAVLGQIIKRSNNASYQICTTAGAMSASEPAFSDTAGTTTTDTTAVWTSLGPVGSFTGGQAPNARLASACTSTWFVAGNTIYVGDNHAETAGTPGINIATIGGSTGAVAKFICHKAVGPYPPTANDLTTGATISTTGAFAISITLSGSAYFSGIAFRPYVGSSTTGTTFTLTSSASVANQAWVYFKDCAFQMKSTGFNSAMQIGNTSGFISMTFNNTTVEFGAVTQTIYLVAGIINWQNTAPFITGSIFPTSGIFSLTGYVTHSVIFEGVDLSQVAGPLFLFPGLGSAAYQGSFLIKDCKLNAAGTIASPLTTGYTVQLVRSSA
jgi:hypothetical protein